VSSTDQRRDRRAVVSWSLYDLANTIYYAIVVTWGIPPLVRERYGAPAALGYVISGTLVLSAVVSPSMGAQVDRTGRAIPGLTLWTILCVSTTAVLSFVAPHGLWPTLAAFAASLFAYQTALTFYNALLPAVAPPGREGSVSGLGTGLGYVGLPASILLALYLRERWGVGPAFLMAAVLMTAWTVPLWLWVRDDPRRVRAAAGRKRSVLDALRAVAKDRTLLLFLVANFVCADVANTLIVWANDYFQHGEDLEPDLAGKLQIALAMTAFLGGIVVGRLADRVSPTAIYLVCCVGLGLGLVGMVVFPKNPWSRGFLILTGGVGVAAIWTVGRQLVMSLVPKERHGEFFGLYGVTVKVSVIGTLLFGVLSEDGDFADAILVEAGMLAVGIGLLAWLHVRLGRTKGTA
jgi:UMF1 family MFS transporter